MNFRRKKTLLYNGVSLFLLICIIHTARVMITTYTSRHSTVKVLIVAYMRSGSTLTGDILEQQDSSFYIYEPLRAIAPPRDSETIITENLVYANGMKRWAPITFSKEAYSTFYKWFTCDLVRLPTVGIFDVFMGKGEKTAQFVACYTNASLVTMNHSHAMGKCLSQLTDVCEQSKVKIIKTIRLYVKEVKPLLEEFPDLKVIHLIRDPRPMIVSRTRFGICTDKTACSSRLCNKMSDDINESRRLKRNFPNRIMTLRYEDLARFPIETSQKMYDFIGVRMTSETREFVYNKTMAGQGSDCIICSTRANSSLHIDSWKRSIDRESLEITNRECRNVIRRLDYEIFPAG